MWGHRCGNVDGLLGIRMYKLQLLCGKHQFVLGRIMGSDKAILFKVAISGIADDGVEDVFKVSAYLVHTSVNRFGSYQRVAGSGVAVGGKGQLDGG